MSRASLPTEATAFTPGYSWRIDLDVRFDGERPTDWPDWTIRMHVYSGDLRFTLSNGSGVTVETVDLQDGEAAIPVIRMSAAQTEQLRGATQPIFYTIDFQAPDGEPEDYFAGPMAKRPGPPAGMLS